MSHDLSEKSCDVSWEKYEDRNILKEFQNLQRALLIDKPDERLDTLRRDVDFNIKQSIKSTDELNHIFHIKQKPITLVEPTGAIVKCFGEIHDNQVDLLSVSERDGERYKDESEIGTMEQRKLKSFSFLKKGNGMIRFKMSPANYKDIPSIYKNNKIKTYRKDPKYFEKIKMPLKQSLNHGRSVNSKATCARQCDVKKKFNTYQQSYPCDEYKEKGNVQCLKDSIPSKRDPALHTNVNTTHNKKEPTPQSKDNIVYKKQHIGNAMDTLVHKSDIRDIRNTQIDSRPKQKLASLPVHIFLPEKKTSDFDQKQKEILIPKTPIKELSLSSMLFTAMRSKDPNSPTGLIISPETKKFEEKIEEQMRKDQNELQRFELLEGKVNDSSFCSNASFVAQLLNSSTPRMDAGSHCDEVVSAADQETTVKELAMPIPNCAFKKIRNANNETIGIVVHNKGTGNIVSSEEEGEEDDDDENDQTNRELGKKRFTNCAYVNADQVACESEEEGLLESVEAVPAPFVMPTQREMASRIARKALQDNVKSILNWDVAPVPLRKVRKIGRKVKRKPKEFHKVQKDSSIHDKIVFNGAELKKRLDDLEMENQYFRKQNKLLEKKQKDFDGDRLRLEKDRKDFERNTQEEYDKLAVLREKLQKDRAVLEKYSKQVRNQPSRQDREEMACQKKEIERLNELLATKEARWGAAQARLRNNCKALEKENRELKNELDSTRKEKLKKVTFEREFPINTKIIHSINDDMNKWLGIGRKCSLSAKERYQSTNAKVNTNLRPKPIRRMNSVPDMKERLSDEGKCRPVKGKKDGGRCSAVDTDLETLNTQDYNSGSFDAAAPLGESQGSRGSGDVEEVASPLQDLMNKMAAALDIGAEPRGYQCLDEQESPHEQQSPYEQLRQAMSVRCQEAPRSALIEPNSPLTSPRCSDFVFGTGTSRDDDSRPRQKRFPDGRTEVQLPSGDVTITSADGHEVVTKYANGDVMTNNLAEGIEKYWYSNQDVTEIRYKDGLRVFEYRQQTEYHRPDGSVEVRQPSGTKIFKDAQGTVSYLHVDGTKERITPDGHVVKEMPNGQRQVFTKEHKRREYADGTVKLVYPNGVAETRYANGRIRIKDSMGRLVMDTLPATDLGP